MKKLVISLLLVMQVVAGWAQQTALVKGKVVDSKTQKPMLNVVATLQGNNLTANTNIEGVFVFEKVAEGSQTVTVSSTGFVPQTFKLEVTAGQALDLGVIVLVEDITTEQQLALITITENDLGDDNSGSENTAGLLQASRDIFQQAAAFNWGQARFRIRGLDNEYGVTMINGISMNKVYDGRPQWSNWGGLNDATRNQEFTMGSGPSDYTFGNILGTQEINTRASVFRPGTRISFSGTNTNYNWRAMATHASGLDANGIAYVISASRRWAQEGYFDGTDYGANSFFASIEKRFGENHSLNFTSIFAQNSRGKNSPNTQEVTDLKGVKYNSYWGWQDGKKRNSRDKDVEEPVFMLSHYWKIGEKTNLNTNAAYQIGYISNSRIDFQQGANPDPTYYQNLPSFYLNSQAYYEPTGELDGDGNPIMANPQSVIARNNFINNGQLDWNALYIANKNSANGGRSVYALYEDRTEDKQFTANSILHSQLSDNIIMNGGITFRKLKSNNFQKLTDLLGGEFFSDIDPFFQGDQSQSDLNNPNRIVGVGDKYGYNYDLHSTSFDGFTQFRFSYTKFDFYLAQQFTRTEYRRDGLYRNGIYANNSYGKSTKEIFENFGFKGGLTYKLTGRHMFALNGAYLTKAPTLRNTFSNARLNNNITPELESERIFSVDASYIIRAPKFKMRLTGFMSKVSDATKVSFFYGEGLFDEDVVGDGNEDSFISEIVTGIEKRNIGTELGMEYQITSTIKATFAATYGQYIFSKNPNVKVNDDAQATGANGTPVTDFGTAYLKNYRQGGMPQQAYSFGLEYRDPKFWWIGANVNYLADSYIDASSIMRTTNFVVEQDGLGYEGATNASVKQMLKQEKFDDFTLVNLQGGKSWLVSSKNRNTIGFFAMVNNVFDVTYKTGGFEQSRKATFADLQADNANGTPSFGNKYFYGYGRTFFVNVFFNF